MFNILEDPCIEATIRNSTKAILTLPGVLASLGENTIAGFDNLRPHQRHPWHAFLCQLSAMALIDSGIDMPEADRTTPYSHLPGKFDEKRWKAFLLNLAPDPDAWNLLVRNLSKPAFLQPPIPDGIKALGTVVNTPDEMDVIIAAKNCDEKARKVTEPKIDHWLFALVSLQGQAGYSKAGRNGNYYNTTRQNGAYATRPGIGIISSPFWGDQWGRDCRMLIETLHTERSIEWDIQQGHRLLWLIPWDGKSSVSLGKLHPYFLEICRRIRLDQNENGKIICRMGSSTVGRVAGGIYKGAVNDPWIPINRQKVSAFNNNPTWDQMGKILLDRKEFQPALAQIPQSFDRCPIAVRFCVLKRGQSHTDEYHEKIIPIPEKKVGYLRLQNNTGEKVLSTMTNLGVIARNKVLYPSLSLLLSGKGKKQKTHPLAAASTRQLDDMISDSFFPYLWEALPAEGDEKTKAQQYNPWIEFLRIRTTEIFETVLRRHLNSGLTEMIHVADAELFFKKSTKQNLPLFNEAIKEESSNG